MNHSDHTPRKDPLVDAYRQASEREGARPGAGVRAAVLAHARVVAQSGSGTGQAAATASVSETVLATPAANESSPIWRLAAGVVIGLLGVWLYQLTQAPDKADTAVASAPASVSTASPASPPAEKAKSAESVSAVSAGSAASASAPAETSVAAAAPSRPALAARTPMDAAPPRARADVGTPETRRTEPAIAMATDAARPEKKEQPATTVATNVAAPAAGPAQDSASGALANDAARETMIASAELRKSARAAVRDEPRVAAATVTAAPPAPAAPPLPNAFPAQSTAMAGSVATAPAPATAAAPRAGVPAAAPAPMAGIGASAPAGLAANKSDTDAVRPQAAAKINEAVTPERRTQLGELDQSLFAALRTGNIGALRTAIARGANVNVRDERGRTAIQIARERGDVEAVRVLEASGAR